MGKYTFSDRGAAPRRTIGAHPIWRGVGCAMMVIVPIFSYALADLLVENNMNRLPVPPSWLGNVTFPPLLHMLTGLTPALNFLSGIRHLPANLFFTVVIMIVIGGVMGIVYAIIYRLFGPPKYGPTDAPPPSRKAKPYKR